MKIAGFFKKENIVLDLKSNNKEKVIIELSQVLKNLNMISDYDLFVQDVFEREKVKSTGIGNYIAIPHARTDAVNDFCIVFGRSNEGIKFDSIDGNPVKLFFLMGTPKQEGLQNYLQILAHLSRLLKKDGVRQKLVNVQSQEGLIDIFKTIEG